MNTAIFVFVAIVLVAALIGANDRSWVHRAVPRIQVLVTILIIACQVVIGVDWALRSCPCIIVDTRLRANFAVFKLVLVFINAQNDISIAEPILVFDSHAVVARLQLVALFMGRDVFFLILIVPADIAVPPYDTIIICADVDIFATFTNWNFAIGFTRSTVTDFTFIIIEEFPTIFTNACWFWALIIGSNEHKIFEFCASLAFCAFLLVLRHAEVDLLRYFVPAEGG